MRAAFVSLAAAALLGAGACGLVPVVSPEQAASDLGCSPSEIHVDVGLVRAQVARGCGRSITYVRVCGRGGCRFEPVRTWAQRGGFR